MPLGNVVQRSPRDKLGGAGLQSGQRKPRRASRRLLALLAGPRTVAPTWRQSDVLEPSLPGTPPPLPEVNTVPSLQLLNLLGNVVHSQKSQLFSTRP